MRSFLARLELRPLLGVRHQSSRAERPPLFSWLKHGPRSKAELWGLILGASLFPLGVAVVNYVEKQKLKQLSPPELAPAFISTKEVALTPKQQLGGPFRLKDSKTGNYITDADLFHDHWTLLYFGFSKCAEVCPNTLTYLADVMRQCDDEYGSDPELGPEEKRLQSAFLSIDFIRDTPDVVEKFVSKYDPRIRGLCGTKAEVEQAARVWRVYYSSVDETEEERVAREEKGVPPPEIDEHYQFDHSSAIYLVGPDGKMKDLFFKEMGQQDTVDRLGVHFSNVYGFSDTRKPSE